MEVKKNIKHKNIWEKILQPGEEIIFEFGIGERYIKVSSLFYGTIFLFFGVLFSIFFNSFWGLSAFFAPLVFIFIRVWFLRISHVYGFSNKRVLIHQGWLNTSLVSVDFKDITDVMVFENFIEKIFFGIGRLIINTAGTTEHEIKLALIENPYEVKKILYSIKEEK